MSSSRSQLATRQVVALSGLFLMNQAAHAQPQEWWREAVFYEIFVRSFADSTAGPLAGDGIGDLRGIIERLDSLNDGDPDTTDDLGVTALWLMPIAESPSYHGYDVTDYRRVDTEYGTQADFLELVNACHGRGMKVIVDTVINHCSSEHPWFQSATDPEDPRHDWFVWANTPPTGPGEPNHTVWHGQQRERSGQDYYGFFWHGMPDFNLRSPDATRAVYDFSQFWLTEMQADGLRLDAIKHLIEDGVQFENTPDTIAWLGKYNAAMHAAQPDAFLVGEVWSDTATINQYIADGCVDSAFAFPLASAINISINESDAATLNHALTELVKTERFGQFGTFIGNHDMDRVMNRLDGSIDRAKLAATLLLTLPGIPFIYYGEEIGMSGTKPDPDIRTPMQWNADTVTGGFSSGVPWRAVNADVHTINVESQTTDADSLLSLYRQLIRLRAQHQSLATGSIELLSSGHDSVVAYRRHTLAETHLVIINLSPQPVSDYRIFPTRGEPTRELLHGVPTTTNPIYPIRELTPYTGYIVELTDTPR